MFCYQYFARIVFQQCASVGEAIPAICRDLLTNLFGVAAVESIRFLVIQLQNKNFRARSFPETRRSQSFCKPMKGGVRVSHTNT
jgi:hypothetical protein